MKNRLNDDYLDNFKSSGRWFERLGLHRILARRPPVAAAGNDAKMQQYLDMLRDEGPIPGGPAAREDSLVDAG